jgi:hypothetical protein
VGFEVLTEVVMKSSVYLDIPPCSPLKIKRRLIGKCRVHLQGRIISQKRNKSEVCSKQNNRLAERAREAMGTGCSFCPTGGSTRTPSCFLYKRKFRLADYSACYLIHAGFLLRLFFDTEDGGDSRETRWD